MLITRVFTGAMLEFTEPNSGSMLTMNIPANRIRNDDVDVVVVVFVTILLPFTV